MELVDGGVVKAWSCFSGGGGHAAIRRSCSNGAISGYFGNGTVLIYAGEAAITMVYDLFLVPPVCRRFCSSSFSVSAGAVVSFCKLQKTRPMVKISNLCMLK